MSVVDTYSYIHHWYGMRRLQQAVTSGMFRRDAPAAGVEEAAISFDSTEGFTPRRFVSQKATYAHPYLGLNLDMMI